MVKICIFRPTNQYWIFLWINHSVYCHEVCIWKIHSNLFNNNNNKKQQRMLTWWRFLLSFRLSFFELDLNGIICSFQWIQMKCIHFLTTLPKKLEKTDWLSKSQIYSFYHFSIKLFTYQLFYKGCSAKIRFSSGYWPA